MGFGIRAVPVMLPSGDMSEMVETDSFYLKLRGRVEKPNELAGFFHDVQLGARAGISSGTRQCRQIFGG
jgi:hypothetical protein